MFKVFPGFEMYQSLFDASLILALKRLMAGDGALSAEEHKYK